MIRVFIFILILNNVMGGWFGDDDEKIVNEEMYIEPGIIINS